MKEPIRIAHIMGKMVGGGVESFIMNYYRNIDRNKIQFDFIVDEDSKFIPKKEIEKLGGKIIEIPPYQKIFKYTQKLKKVLRENDYKIVHSHLNALSVIPLYCAFSVKIPVRIAHSHSTTNKKEWKKNFIKNILRPFSKIFATNYFACSEHAARWLFGNKTFEAGKVEIIHNAIDIKKFKYNDEIRNKIRKELNLENKFVLGHIGRFVKQKNHEFLIEVFSEIHKKNNDAVLLLIGDGPLENKIKEKIKKMNLYNSVYFLGIKDNVNEIIQALDIFVFPSLYEGLGIVLIEAQCANLTCLASNQVPKEVKISNSISFLELDKKKWIDEIEKINNENNSNRKNQLSDQYKNYEIQNEANNLLNKYIEILEG